MNQTAFIPELVQEFHRIDSVQRNRKMLKHFIELAKNAQPGRSGYVYNVVNRSKKDADQQCTESIERLERACKRAEVSFETVCQENGIPTLH